MSCRNCEAIRVLIAERRAQITDPYDDETIVLDLVAEILEAT